MTRYPGKFWTFEIAASCGFGIYFSVLGFLGSLLLMPASTSIFTDARIICHMGIGWCGGMFLGFFGCHVEKYIQARRADLPELTDDDAQTR